MAVAAAVPVSPRPDSPDDLLLIQAVVWAEGCARHEHGARVEEICRRLHAQLRDALSKPVRLPPVNPDVAAAHLARTWTVARDSRQLPLVVDPR